MEGVAWYDHNDMKNMPPLLPSLRASHRASALYERIYACVGEVPFGCVTTYGTVGGMIGCSARVVGYALHYLRHVDRRDVPWQRVINARGMISTHGNEQRRLLEAEGVIFDDEGRIDFARFGWPGGDTVTR